MPRSALSVGNKHYGTIISKTQNNQLFPLCRWHTNIIRSQPLQHPSHLSRFNTLHPKLQFTAEAEKDNAINYLDVNIHRTSSGWKTAVYRKPTSTDTIIPYTSKHPPQQKYAAIRFLYNRLNTYNLQPTAYLQEENTIHNILYNNGFPIKPHKLHQPKPQKQRQNTHMQTYKWITFTYTRK